MDFAETDKRYVDRKAIGLVFFFTVLVLSGQFSWTHVSTVFVSSLVVVLVMSMAVIKPSTSISLICIGCFAPTLLNFKYTLLPGNYYIFFAVMLLSLIISMVLQKNNYQYVLSSIKSILPYAVLLVIIAVSQALSEIPKLKFSFYLSYLVGLVVMLLIRKKSDEDLTIMTLVASGVIFSGWTLFGQVRLDATGERFAIGFDQNYCSFFIGLGIVILTSFIFHRKSLTLSAKILFSSILILDWIAILRLGSRGVIISIAVAIAWLFVRNSRNISKIFVNCLVGACLFLVIVNLPGVNMMTERFQGKDIKTLSQRVPLWNASLDHISNSEILELLVGGGTDAGKYALKEKMHGNLPISPHNQYIEILMDYGLLGLMALLWLFFAGFKLSLSHYGYAGDIRSALIVFNLVGFMVLTPLRYGMPWVALGLIVSSPEEIKNV